MKKLAHLTIAAALALTACGGDSGSDEATPATASETQIIACEAERDTIKAAALAWQVQHDRTPTFADLLKPNGGTLADRDYHYDLVSVDADGTVTLKLTPTRRSRRVPPAEPLALTSKQGAAMPARTGRRWREHIVPRVIRRDRGICHLCGQPGADTADHILPVSLGGTDALDNLAAAHHNPCNIIRGNRPVDVVRAELAQLQPDSSAWTW